MDVQTDINDLKGLVDASASQTVRDGVSTTVDLEHARRRLIELKRRYWAGRGKKRHAYLSQPLTVTGGAE